MAGGCLIAHGLVARFGGRADEAAARYGEALELCVRAGDPANAPLCLEGMAAAAALEDPERAARLLGAAQALFDTGFLPSVPGFEAFSEMTAGMLAEALGPERAAELQARGAALASTRPLSELAAA